MSSKVLPIDDQTDFMLERVDKGWTNRQTKERTDNQTKVRLCSTGLRILQSLCPKRKEIVKGRPKEGEREKERNDKIVKKIPPPQNRKRRKERKERKSKR